MDDDTGEFIPASQIKSGPTEVLEAPEPPQINPCPRTGQLPSGWHFADE